MDSQKFGKFLLQESEAFKSHQFHVIETDRILKLIHEDIMNVNALKIESFPELKRIVIDRISYSNLEIMKGLNQSMMNGNYSTVDVLSRTSIEFSTNIIYILISGGDLGAREFVSNYLVHHVTKLKKW